MKTRTFRLAPVRHEETHRARASQLLRIAERRPLTKPEQDRLMMSLLKARQACNALELCDPKARVKASPKLHDLATLESHGVEVAPDLATRAVEEAEQWAERLANQEPPGRPLHSQREHGAEPTPSRAIEPSEVPLPG